MARPKTKKDNVKAMIIEISPEAKTWLKLKAAGIEGASIKSIAEGIIEKQAKK